MWPQLEYMKIVFESNSVGAKAFGIDQTGWLTKPLGVVEIDHVLYFKTPVPRDLFVFCDAFYLDTWIIILASAIFVSLVLCYKGIERNRMFERIAPGIHFQEFRNPEFQSSAFLRFLSQLVFALTSLITFTPESNRVNSYRLSCQKTLFVTWLTMTMILQQYFAGDMMSMLAMEPKPFVIDTLDDLRNKSIIIKALNVQLVSESNDSKKAYFDPKSDYYEDFTNRLEMISVTDILKIDELADEIFGDGVTRPKKDACLMLRKELLESLYNVKDPLFRQQTHVSSEGTSAQFHAFLQTLIADKTESWAVNFALVFFCTFCIFEFFSSFLIFYFYIQFLN